ncbi:MAG: hydroxyacid aldolase [Rhizobiaceae bacterium]|nr:hydroxyacid aldolase [Rhizobiaceae bacterium]
MALPALRAMVGEGGFVLSAWSGLTDPDVHEALARAPFGAVCFDVQHGLHDVASVRAGIARTVQLGKPALVRLSIEDRANAARFLDLGASAVIMPMIEGVADAKAFVDAVKYPPLGARSFGPSRAAELHGYRGVLDYTEVANAETLALAMIETATALDNLGDILAIEGLDGVFVGPSDLSIALSGTCTWSPEGTVAVDAIRRIVDTAHAAGKIAAIYAASAAEARRYRDVGYRLVCVSSDLGMLKAGAAAVAVEVAG